MCNETIKKTVMTTIHEHIGFMDCDSLRKETGLASPDLFFALESLTIEQKISLKVREDIFQGVNTCILNL